ncbi:glycosyltransferase family 2 protein [Dongia deserti]|uniref:glycosyltransferase family 2 protein n=1 Tax=Dongia deserti TaxID=2268030 RepID=UPI000E649E6D|nr:glycosyltransferase family A protein [Dongia deserti]
MGFAADITVVIPVYNGALYLAESVESVRRQSHRPGQIILVDDGSTDATPEVAELLCRDREGTPVRYVRQDNAGPAAAMNRGATLADSALLAFQSADDIWIPQKLEWQLKALADGADLVFGHMQNFISPELDAATAARLQCPPEPMAGCNASTLLTSLETFRKVGRLDERFRIGEFFDWYGRANDLGLTSAMLPQVVAMRRLHGKNHSLSRKTEAVGYAHVLKAMLDRRRAESGQP